MKNLSLQRVLVYGGMIVFWLALILVSTGAFAQSWVNVGNGLQQKVVGVDTSYRFVKTAGSGSPFAITGQLNQKLNLINLQDSLSSIGFVRLTSKSTGLITYYRPSTNTDAARGVSLLTAVSASLVGDEIKISPGDYLITSPIELKESQRVILEGSRIYHTSSSDDLITIDSASNVYLGGSGTIEGTGPHDGTSANEKGINITGSSENCIIEGLNIINFKGYGIVGNNYWGSPDLLFLGNTITNCNFTGNRIGIHIINEYYKLSNLYIRKNHIGALFYGGNQNFSESIVTLNDYGIKIIGGSGNEGHGIVANCLINHNNVSAVHISDLGIGMTFTGNIIAGMYPYATTDTTIYIKSSRGVLFNGGELIAPSQIYLDGTFTGYNFMRGVFIYDDPTAGGTPAQVFGTDLQKSFLRFEQCSSMDSIYSHLNVGIPVVHGGTGRTGVSPYQLLAGGANGLDSLSQLPPGATGQILRSTGSASLPYWSSLNLQDVTSAGAETTIPITTPAITIRNGSKNWDVVSDANNFYIQESGVNTWLTISKTNGDMTVAGITSAGFKLSALNTAPSSSTDTGTAGDIRFTSGFIYLCVATNTWVKTALTTW